MRLPCNWFVIPSRADGEGPHPQGLKHTNHLALISQLREVLRSAQDDKVAQEPPACKLRVPSQRFSANVVTM
jgi:hypothetical protein